MNKSQNSVLAIAVSTYRNMTLISSTILVVLVVFSAIQADGGCWLWGCSEEEDNGYGRSSRDLSQGIDSVVSHWRQKNGRKALEGMNMQTFCIHYRYGIIAALVSFIGYYVLFFIQSTICH